MKKMKRLLAGVLALVLVLAGLPGVVKEVKAEELGGYGYILNRDGNSVSIVKYTGQDTKVIIPSKINGKSVTSINSGSFKGCSSVASITIPDSVTSIDGNAFGGCSSLTSINIPESVTSIGWNAFSGCSSLANIKVNNKNTRYDSRDNCNAIIETEKNELVYGCKNTIIPNSVTSIGGNAFSGCSGLTSITIPDSVTSIGGNAFSGCSGLTSITIPDSVTSIGGNAFGGCSGLTSINIPDSVESIGAYAFEDCSSLTSITIPASVTRIDRGVFEGCSGLKNIKVDNENTRYDSRDNCNAIIETKKNELIYGCKNTIIPNSVESIGAYAFRKCSSLTSISIPNSVTSIRDDAFLDCDSLTSITIPASVTEIRSEAIGYHMYHADTEYYVPFIQLGFIIYGFKGSAAEKYANKEHIIFHEISDGDPSQSGDSKIDIAKSDVALGQNSYTYDGTAKTPSVTVKLDGKELTFGTDYTLVYNDNINVGTAKVTVTGKGSYTGSKTINFTIAKTAETSDSSITCEKAVYKVVYGTKPFTINVTSKSGLSFTSSNPKVASVDKNTGKVTIKRTGIAMITASTGEDSVKVTVRVSPKRQSVKSVKALKGRKLIVKWAKDQMATGYQVQISTSKKFKKIAKQKKVKKKNVTFTKLKTGKKYYVRIRSYKKSGKETLYGIWSKVKKSSKVKQ